MMTERRLRNIEEAVQLSCLACLVCLISDLIYVRKKGSLPLLSVAIGLGSNLGDPVGCIYRAVRRLMRSGLQDIALSSLYETAPVDCVPGTPNFVNAALTGKWSGEASALLSDCHSIERALGRPRAHSSSEARTIDIDLLLVDDYVAHDEDLKVPHPLLTKRLFVLVPLCEIAPLWEVPGVNRTVGDLCAEKLAVEGRENITLYQPPTEND